MFRIDDSRHCHLTGWVDVRPSLPPNKLPLVASVTLRIGPLKEERHNDESDAQVSSDNWLATWHLPGRSTWQSATCPHLVSCFQVSQVLSRLHLPHLFLLLQIGWLWYGEGQRQKLGDLGLTEAGSKCLVISVQQNPIQPTGDTVERSDHSSRGRRHCLSPDAMLNTPEE